MLWYSSTNFYYFYFVGGFSKMDLKDIEIKPPNISDETMKEMVKFFMKTSIPRIIEHERLKN